MFKPYDLDKTMVLEMLPKVNINDLVRSANKSLKLTLLKSKLEALGQSLSLGTSKTRFGGTRCWFKCPKCLRRVGTLYWSNDQTNLKCRSCLKLLYFKQKSRS